MRINCVGLADLLCAYADGELSDANRQLVEDHLAICDNCTSILKIYREISTSVNDTCGEPPASLVTGVMERITNEEVPRADKETVERKRNKFILKRYLPAAACFVAMLLVWQFWGSTLFTGQVNDTAPAASAPRSSADLAVTDSGAGGSAGESVAAPAGESGEDRIMMDAEDEDIYPPGDDTNSIFSIRSEHEIELFVDYLSSAYAEIIISGELPAILLD